MVCERSCEFFRDVEDELNQLLYYVQLLCNIMVTVIC